MPVLNGLDTCKKLRKKYQSKDLLIIFVSALVTSEQRLAGYEAGGDDYVTKPFDEAELIYKVKLAIQQQQQYRNQQAEIQSQKEDKDMATRSAMSAILSSSEMNVVIDFMKAIITVNNIDELILQAKEAFLGYDLSGCIMINHLDAPQFFFTDNFDRPIEKDILKEAHHKGKIISFSGRAIFNSRHAAMLIRKMPENVEKKNRYKEHLLVMIDAIEEKLLNFTHLANEQAHFLKLEDTIHSVAKRLEEVKESNYEQRSLNAKILGELVHSAEESFIHLGLDEKQEGDLRTLLENAERESNLVFDQGKAAEITFDEIVQDLKQLTIKS